MAAFDEHKDELEHFEQMMGPWRGRLAVTLDRLTDAMILVGQHGVYCRSSRDPGKARPRYRASHPRTPQSQRTNPKRDGRPARRTRRRQPPAPVGKFIQASVVIPFDA